LLSLVLLVSCNNHAKNQKANGLVQTKVKTYKVANGWAFSIYLGEKEYIRQPFIPGMPGKIPFATDSQAMEAGKLILGKMVTHKTPTISLEELKEHHLLPPAGNIQ
jgi:hypothetical protein